MPGRGRPRHGADQLYRLTYDGSIVDEPEYVVMGGQADTVAGALKQSFRTNLPLAEAVSVAVQALGSVGGENGAGRVLVADSLEVAVLDRNRGHRKFRRIVGPALSSLLPGNGSGPAETSSEQAGADTPPTPGHADGSDG